ncbi:MAG: hypothetical protein EPN77_19465 [Candidimonas sp.]|nr:MAG: hypothetical protein EPN77_19465 [Candidimonas sp.]
MNTWYSATAGIVEAANIAMAEIAAGHADGKEDKIRAVWEPVANALNNSIPEEFERDWPELYDIAEKVGPDFVGVTSDTRHVVTWGADNGTYREFVIANT